MSCTLCYPLFVDEESRSHSAKSLARGCSRLMNGGAALSHRAGVVGHAVPPAPHTASSVRLRPPRPACDQQSRGRRYPSQDSAGPRQTFLTRYLPRRGAAPDAPGRRPSEPRLPCAAPLFGGHRGPWAPANWYLGGEGLSPHSFRINGPAHPSRRGEGRCDCPYQPPAPRPPTC